MKKISKIKFGENYFFEYSGKKFIDSNLPEKEKKILLDAFGDFVSPHHSDQIFPDIDWHGDFKTDKSITFYVFISYVCSCLGIDSFSENNYIQKAEITSKQKEIISEVYK